MAASRSVTATAAVLAVGAAIAAGSGVAAATSAAASEPAPRITSAGGINLVPTPSGLGLGDLSESTMSACAIGSGCAARTWGRLIGPDANNPDQTLVMQSNVAYLPTTRLAKRDIAALKQQFEQFQANSGFAGTVVRKTSDGYDILKISGYFDQTVDDDVRIVQVRKGTMTVSIQITLDSILTEGKLPAATSVKALTKKAKAVFKKSWAQVPTSVLPGGGGV